MPIFDTPKSTSNLVAPPRSLFLSYAKKAFYGYDVVSEMEIAFAELHNTEFCISFCNGFAAIALAIKVMATEGKDEVIIPSLAYRRTDSIVRWAYKIPIFCEVSPVTRGMTKATVADAITPNTGLILAAHPITTLCDIDGISDLAAEHRIPLLFDSVEAAVATHRGRAIGTFPDAEAFSLHASKLINGCEGGYITTDSQKIATKLKELQTPDVALNPYHAAMAIAGRDNLSDQLHHNFAIHKEYQRSLAHLPLSVISYDEEELRTWKNVVVRIESEWPLSRDETIEKLNEQNILARAYYESPLHLKYGLSMPNTERMAKQYMILPSGAFVTTQDVQKIARFLDGMAKR